MVHQDRWTSRLVSLLKVAPYTLASDLSLKVDDVDAVLARIQQRVFSVEYGPLDEPWGIRRFYVRDPFGKLVNILAHR